MRGVWQIVPQCWITENPFLHPHRGEAPQVFVLRQNLPDTGPEDGSRTEAQRRQALQVQVLRQELRLPGESADAHLNTHRSEAIPLPKLWRSVFVHYQSASPPEVTFTHMWKSPESDKGNVVFIIKKTVRT